MPLAISRNLRIRSLYVLQIAFFTSLLCDLDRTALAEDNEPTHKSRLGSVDGFPRRPLRIVRLISGEQISAEWLHADRHRVTVRLEPGRTIEVPREAIAEIANPPRMLDVWDSEAAESADGTIPLTPPIAAGMLQVWLSETPVRPANYRWRLPFVDDNAVKQEFVVQLSADGYLEFELPSEWQCQFRQRFVVDDRLARLLRAAWNDSAWSLQLGDMLVAKGRKPVAALTEIAPFPNVPPFRDVVVRRIIPDIPAAAVDDPLQDAIVLADGIVLFGRIECTDSSGLSVLTGDRRIRVPWTDFIRARFSAAKLEAPDSAALAGSIVEITRPEVGGLVPRPSERLIGAMSQTTDGVVTLEHSWFGPGLVVGNQQQIQPRYRGTWQWLLPETVHLGDEICPDLTPSLPQGTSRTGKWTLPTIPQGQIIIEAEIAEMEPSGSATPPTQARLAETRAGHWTTELWINEQRIGNWNSQLSWRPSVLSPARVRLEVPRYVLRTGHNTWELRQHPGPTQDAYDDVWIGRLALEIIDPTE